MWDCKSQSTKPIQVLEEARDSVSTLHVVGHEICTGSVDGRVRLYDLRMGMVYVDVVGREHDDIRLFSSIRHSPISLPQQSVGVCYGGRGTR